MSEPEHATDSQTPAEHAHAAHAHPPVRILWWTYFVLIALFWLLSVFSVNSLPDALQTAFWALGLVGLWGYLHHLAIGRRPLWSGYLALFAIWVPANIVLRFIQAPPSGWLAPLIAALGIVLLFGPMAWALWRYALRCPNIWRTSR